MLIGPDMALDVGDINETLSFYEFELRSNSDATGFVELGDRFLALQEARSQPASDF